MSESVAQHLNRHLKPRIPFQELADPTQAVREIGPIAQCILRIGIIWAWLLVKDGKILMGDMDWNATPEDAVKAADAALEAGGSMID